MSSGPSVAELLPCRLNAVTFVHASVYDRARGMQDEVIIQKAFAESRLLITNDKGFGEKIYTASMRRS